jgi:hypothetical protein
MERSFSFWIIVISASGSSLLALDAALGPAADPPITTIFLLSVILPPPLVDPEYSHRL